MIQLSGMLVLECTLPFDTYNVVRLLKIQFVTGHAVRAFIGRGRHLSTFRRRYFLLFLFYKPPKVIRNVFEGHNGEQRIQETTDSPSTWSLLDTDSNVMLHYPEMECTT